MKRLLPVLFGFALLLLSSTKGWSLPPCPGSPTSDYYVMKTWTDCEGTSTYAKGNKYVGEWKDGTRHGKGTFTFDDGRMKKGIWENNKFLHARKLSPKATAKKFSSEGLRARLLLIKRLESEGLITKEEAASKRRSILGLSSADEQDAKPPVTAENVPSNVSSLPPCVGNYTVTTWTDCFGTFTNTGGNKYVGEYRDDKKHGQGTYTYAIGDTYVGGFNYGRWHGQGTATYADGRVEEGIFKNGNFQYAKKPSPTVTAKKSATPSSSKNEKELEKPYSITLPTKAMLFYETRNLNWQKGAREALEKEKSEINLKILLSADEISRGVPFSVPGDKKNTCGFKLEKRDWDDPNLSQLTWDLPCVVQTFVNETGISNLKKTYRISGCLQTKVLGRHHLCLKKPKNNASFFPNEGWARISGAPNNKTTSIDKTMLRPLSPISSTDPWLRKTKNLQDPCNVIPHYQIVDVRYCNSKGSCLTRPWKIAKGKPLKLPSLDQIRWKKFKVLPSEVEFRFKKIEGEGFQNKPKIRVKIGKGTKLSSLIRPPKQKLISGPAYINDFGNIPSDLNAKFALFTSKKKCDSAVRSRPKYWRPYHPNHNGEMKAHQCTYAKILKGRESLSNCVLPKRDSGKWVYSFVKDRIQGERLPPCPGSPAFRRSTARNWTDCFGSRTYSNGERYVGEWKDRKYHGQGTFSFFNGRVKQKQEGIWEYGRFLYARKFLPTVTAEKTPPKVDQQKRLELSRRTQEALQVLGLYSGKLDGIIGVITKSAIQRWQQRNGYTGTGEVTELQLAKLEQEAATMLAKKKPSPEVTAKKSSLEKAKEQCAEIGFTKGTEKFGDCVMKLLN